MKWEKLGLVWKPDGKYPWARSHAMVPTPFMINDKTIRVFLTTLDQNGVGRPSFVDVSADDPKKILGVSNKPILELGSPGTFDDNGVMTTSLVKSPSGEIFMYYAGFEIGAKIRYRIFTGLAISEDNGCTFQKFSSTPILDRSDGETFFRSGAFAIYEQNNFKMWYVAGSTWTKINNKEMPVYDLRYAESQDGKIWPKGGSISLTLSETDEHGFGRPWVAQRGPKSYQLFYSIRRRSLQAYRLGFAESQDGKNWTRKDAEMGLDITPSSFDGEAIMYSAVINVGQNSYCFYNGNNFGKEGFAVARLVNR